MSAGWDVREPVDSVEQHVVPLDDIVDHNPHDCACGPTTEAIERPDGSMGWLVVHHSLDGREQHEPDRRA